jgi:hypothetical protein
MLWKRSLGWGEGQRVNMDAIIMVRLPNARFSAMEGVNCAVAIIN